MGRYLNQKSLDTKLTPAGISLCGVLNIASDRSREIYVGRILIKTVRRFLFLTGCGGRLSWVCEVLKPYY